MQNKKYTLLSTVATMLLVAILSFFDNLSFWWWLFIGVIVEILLQIVGQFVFKKAKKNDDHGEKK